MHCDRLLRPIVDMDLAISFANHTPSFRGRHRSLFITSSGMDVNLVSIFHLNLVVGIYKIISAWCVGHHWKDETPQFRNVVNLPSLMRRLWSPRQVSPSCLLSKPRPRREHRATGPLMDMVHPTPARLLKYEISTRFTCTLHSGYTQVLQSQNAELLVTYNESDEQEERTHLTKSRGH